MRAFVILALLLLGMHQVLPLGQRGLGADALLAFGFLILAATTVGELAARLRLPKIVGYMAAGILFGPEVMQTVTAEGAERLAPISRLAVALIAFMAGAELRWHEVKQHGPALVRIVTAEMGLTFVAITALMFTLTQKTPFMPLSGATEAFAFSLLFASIAVAHSPAATLALLTETKARGPVARSTLGVVLISDVAVVILFSLAAATTRALAPSDGAGPISAGAVVWELVGGMLVGAVLGVGIAAYLRFVRRELVLFGVLIAFFGAEIARVAHVDVLLVLLVAGFLTENVSQHGRGEELRSAMERSAAPIFVVFFALAGAAINLRAVAALGMIAGPVVLVRLFTIWLGTRFGARWARVSPIEQKYIWLGLVSQAGVAIGLASVVASQYPVRGAPLQALLLATIAVNQVLGPILFRSALVKSGELEPARG